MSESLSATLNGLSTNGCSLVFEDYPKDSAHWGRSLGTNNANYVLGFSPIIWMQPSPNQKRASGWS
ncbi:hypothetical protein C8D77_11565 [Mesorhizobium loti]|uniref:Uncharacterized protein n=1 Tax=Rhizobium loti TaxID=381 RepID=A0A8E3B2C2_RHILI|nr:hypothetical protein C8D77_11565 [Mesorhizobium loti]